MMKSTVARTLRLSPRIWPSAFGPDRVRSESGLKWGASIPPVRGWRWVGVVEELKNRGLPENPTQPAPTYFRSLTSARSISPCWSEPPLSRRQCCRHSHDPRPDRAIDAGTPEDSIGGETERPRFSGWLLAIFAGIALVLAMIGVYGVMSYSVSRRAGEIGLRMLQARGIVSDPAHAAGHSRCVCPRADDGNAHLWVRLDGSPDVRRRSWIARGGGGACLLPASRAARIDPVAALRDEQVPGCRVG
jgi:putative ABC transport system permease protein